MSNYESSNGANIHTVVVQNNTILKKLIENIKKVDGVDKVIRVYNN